MTARRKRKRKSSKKTKSGKKYPYILLILLAIIIATIYTLRTKHWSSKEKMTLLINGDDSMIVVVVVDPVREEMYKIGIPGNTEVEVAGNLGKWKAKTLWALGKQEKLGGILAARSITMGLGLPIYAWADKKSSGLFDIGLKTSLVALFTSYDSNLTFGDKLHLFLFNMKIKNINKVNFNLGETTFLEKTTLFDGGEGYEVSNTPTQGVLAIFSEPSYSERIVRVSIIDATEDSVMAEKVSSVFESLGGKVSSVENSLEFDGVCKVRANHQQLLDVLLKIFECEEYVVSEEQPFDVELTLGDKFVKYY